MQIRKTRLAVPGRAEHPGHRAMSKYTTIVAVIAFVVMISVTHAHAHHERDYERSEQELKFVFDSIIYEYSMIYESPVFRHVHSVRIEDLEYNEAGERLLARRYSDGHRVMARTYGGTKYPVYDAIQTNRRLRRTREPGKRVSVGLVLGDLDDLVGYYPEGDSEVQEIFNTTLVDMFQRIYSLRLPVCVATVVLYADLLEVPAGTDGYHDSFGPLFGIVVTGRIAASESLDPYGWGAPHFWTPLFAREGYDDVFRELVGYYPQWDEWNRIHESYPCPSGE